MPVSVAPENTPRILPLVYLESDKVCDVGVLLLLGDSGSNTIIGAGLGANLPVKHRRIDGTFCPLQPAATALHAAPVSDCAPRTDILPRSFHVVELQGSLPRPKLLELL